MEASQKVGAFWEFLDSAPFAMALGDGRGNLEYLNGRFFQTFGCTLEDTPTLDAWWARGCRDETSRRQAAAAWSEAAAEAARHGGPMRAVPCEIVCGGGEARTFELHGVPMEGKCLFVLEDVTERARAEAALREVEAKFRLFLAHVPVHVFFKDEKLRSLHLSRNFEQLLGRPLQELLGKSMDELFPSAFARKMVPDDERVLREGRPIEIEEELQGRLYSTLKFPIALPGQPRFLAGFTTDVTERKLAENRLRESEERFKSAFDHAAIGMALVAPDGRFLKVNASLCRIVGYSEGELLARSFQDITHPDDLDADLALAAKLFAGEISSYQMEKRYLHKGGGVIWILLSGSVVRSQDGSVLYGIAQIQDITERKRVEELLRQQIERFGLVVDGARDGIWDWDVPNKRVFFSTRWKAIRGFSEEEIGDAEEEWSGRIHPEDAPRVFASVQRHFEGRSPWFSEDYRIRCKDGSWKWIHDRGIALRDGEGRVMRMAGSETDITERKQLEQERDRLIAELREALESIRTLRGIIPICASCKKIRTDKGYWQQVEVYVRDHSEAEFSHGICPECARELYPELGRGP